MPRDFIDKAQEIADELHTISPYDRNKKFHTQLVFDLDSNGKVTAWYFLLQGDKIIER